MIRLRISSMNSKAGLEALDSFSIQTVTSLGSVRVNLAYLTDLVATLEDTAYTKGRGVYPIRRSGSQQGNACPVS